MVHTLLKKDAPCHSIWNDEVRVFQQTLKVGSETEECLQSMANRNMVGGAYLGVLPASFCPRIARRLWIVE